eukprot:TRINITY_DN2796_c1_g1_i2.p1 TRINITY_DN2796_c1_g1~~TRINITY_DN2796_c1_g1_i2.p1  ORF type:complete len:251 (+),score=71.36 TRINITY_DN2796_c1_g1_i2:26-778(+)
MATNFNKVKHLVIGGGVVGLSIASRLSKEGPTLVVERHNHVGEETSSRNSEVIHAGLYYPPKSLKTKYCIKGRKMLYDACKRYNVPHNKVGKWIIATREEECEKLESIRMNALESGVNLNYLDKRSIMEEDQVRAHQVLYSPETGIIDSHSLMNLFVQSIQHNGSDVSLRTNVEDVEYNSSPSSSSSRGRYIVQVRNDDEVSYIESDTIINAAGLTSDTVAKMVMKDKCPLNYKLYYVKGMLDRSYTRNH